MFLGQARVVTRGTRLEQQSTTVIENTITDAITFSVDVGFSEEAALTYVPHLLHFYHFFLAGPKLTFYISPSPPAQVL